MLSTLVLAAALAAQQPKAKAEAGPPPLAEYFRLETERIARDPLKGIVTAEEWKKRRPEFQRQFKEMLGLDPEPKRGPLNAKIHGTIERPDFLIEKVTFESSPGLIVTGNLYRPKVVTKPLPAILYVCGHSQTESDGVVLGSKTHYQHHPAWYAANGFVCLIVDTLQLGELPGIHHGTNRFGLWWWYARGYTPAGVEAWNAVRSLDYLETRPEVDKTRLGVTGRSGGGATTWWVAAIDDRVKAAVPVAGITDLRDHVVDGVVQGHCDCMYHVNTYRWDFNLVAALAAPKALLLENTDADPIFPEDGVRRVYATMEKVYAWENASDRLGLVIGKGGHADTTELRHPSFAFMNKWLKGEEAKVEEPDRRTPDEQLRVIDPAYEPNSRNASIYEDFVRGRTLAYEKASKAEWSRTEDELRRALRTKVVAGWPTEAETGEANVEEASSKTVDGFRVRTYRYSTQPGIRLTAWAVDRPGVTGKAEPFVVVADEAAWKSTWSAVVASFEGKGKPTAGNASPGWQRARARIFAGATLILIAPRGVGPTAWPIERDVHVRRRFALLGQTLDGMRSFDVIRAARTVVPRIKDPVVYEAEGDAAGLLLFASAFEPKLSRLSLVEPPTSFRSAPVFLNLEQVIDLPGLLLLSKAVDVGITTSQPESWKRVNNVGRTLGIGPTVTVTERK